METWSPIVQNVIETRTKCTLYFIKGNVGETYTFTYTGSPQEFVVPYDGVYKIELWGASGGGNDAGQGAYSSGLIYLKSKNALYLYIGGSGLSNTSFSLGGLGGYNGGATASNSYLTSGNSIGSGGGGATDVRLINGNWNNLAGIKSRIMVAAGGGGSSRHISNGIPHAGGLSEYNGSAVIGSTGIGGYGYGASQIQGGSCYCNSSRATCVNCQGTFGYANTTKYSSSYPNPGGGGGGGYYGGGSSATGYLGYTGGSGGGGSSYISGHTGCVAIESENNQNPKSGCTTGTSDISCSYHYSGYQFMNTEMIDGSGYVWTNQKESQKVMPNPNGGFYDLGVGHTGNGFARIQFLGK